MEAKGKCPAKRTPQTGFPSLFQGPLGAGSSGTAAISSATALEGTSALPSSLPAQSWLCFVHHIPLLPGLQFPDPGSSQPSGAAPCCFPGTLGVDTRRQRTHSTAQAAASSAPGAHSIYFPWNLVGRIQSMQWDSIWEKRFGTQPPVTVIPAQGLTS